MAEAFVTRYGSNRTISSSDRSAAETVGVVFKTSLNWMAVAFREDVLVGVTFGHATPGGARIALCRMLRMPISDCKFTSEADLDANGSSAADLVQRLKDYADGQPVDFSDIEFDQSHLTSFGRRIVAACRQIGRGRTRSYGELAATCGSPSAARAVGQVMARNRYPLVVPCHRVLGSSGSLGGFSAPDGVAMKRRLLAIEAE